MKMAPFAIHMSLLHTFQEFEHLHGWRHHLLKDPHGLVENRAISTQELN